MFQIFNNKKRETESEIMNEKINAAIDLAFEAGRWLGQVDLEEHLDSEQYSQVVFESLISKKTSMPQKLSSSGKTVEYNLRSNEWREGVKKSVNQYIEKAKALANNV